MPMPVKQKHQDHPTSVAPQVASSSSNKNKVKAVAAGPTVSYRDDHIAGGRTPVILHYESGSDSSSSLLDGYSSGQQQQRNQPFRRPPPYRSVPLPWISTVADNGSRRARCQNSNRHPPVSMNSSASSTRDGRAKSVPPQWRTATSSKDDVVNTVSGKGNGCKPQRPKSIHQDLPVTGQLRPMWGNGPSPVTNHRPNYQHHHQQQKPPAAPFPQSVSLQFDMLMAPDWRGGLGQLPVPSPAPAERRSTIRTSERKSAVGSESSLCDQRSSSVPRSQHLQFSLPSASTSSSSLASSSMTSSSSRPSRPLSHPASSAMPTSRSHWALSSSQNLHGSSDSVSALPTARSHGHLNRYQQQQQQQLLTPTSQKPLLPLPIPPLRHHWAAGGGVGGGGGYSNGWSAIACATPAPAPSPSSTPSPSGRPLAHLPNDALLRSSHPGLRLLEKKLDLYADIVHAQERFVQVRVKAIAKLKIKRTKQTT